MQKKKKKTKVSFFSATANQSNAAPKLKFAVMEYRWQICKVIDLL